jgi:hypothetical protein
VMKKIWKFLKAHVREDFNPRMYGVIAGFLAVALTLNYTFDFEDDYLEAMEGYPKFFAYLLFYSLPYFFSVYIYAVFSNRKDIFIRTDFWIKSLFAVTILSLDSSVPFLTIVLSKLVAPEVQFWAYKVSVNAISFFTVFIPILIFYFVHDREQHHLYGLRAQKFDTAPYFTMLLIMLPLIVTASFNDVFLRQYPMYKTSSAHAYLDLPEWVTMMCYEIAYGLDFITVEYLFRGFMVIGMMTILGRGAVLTMAVVYCVLHFGKPAGEAISSAFGGYILGVVAYETRSIWGGIIVHMGIAWMMELVAFVQKNL